MGSAYRRAKGWSSTVYSTYSHSIYLVIGRFFRSLFVWGCVMGLVDLMDYYGRPVWWLWQGAG